MQWCDGAACPRTLDGHDHPEYNARLWPTAEDQTRKAAAGLMRAAMGIPADLWGLRGT